MPSINGKVLKGYHSMLKDKSPVELAELRDGLIRIISDIDKLTGEDTTFTPCEHNIREWLAWKSGIYRLYCGCCGQFLGDESYTPQLGLFRIVR